MPKLPTKYEQTLMSLAAAAVIRGTAIGDLIKRKSRFGRRTELDGGLWQG